MRTSRLVTGVVTASLLGATPLALAAPAEARETWSTTTTAEPSADLVEFGEQVDVSLEVDSATGSSPEVGTSTLYARRAGRTDWVAVDTNASPGADFLDVEPRMTTTYKVVYGGGTETDTAKGDRYASSESAPFTVAVKRRITHPSAGFELEGRVTPRYRRKPVRIRASRDQEAGYELVRVVRTDRRGRYSFRLPRRSGTWYWIISVRGDKRFRGAAFGYETSVF